MGTRLGRAILWSAASTWFRLIATLVIFSILARLLGPEAYGLLGMVMVALTLGEVLVGGAVLESIIQKRDLDAGHKDTMFWTLAGAGLAMTGLMAASAPLLAFLFDQDRLTALVIAASPILVLRALFSLPEALLRRSLRYKTLAAASSAAVVSGGALGVGLALAGYGVWSLIASQLVQAAVQLAIAWPLSRYWPNGRQTRGHFRDLWKFNLSVLAIRLVGYVDQMVPRIAIALMMGPLALGHFNAARRLIDMIKTGVTQPLTAVALPTFSGLQAERKSLGDLLRATILLSSTLGFPCFAGFAVVAPDLVPLLLGEQWVDTVPLVQILALIGFRASAMSFNAILLRSLGCPHWHLAMLSFGSTLGIVLVFLAVGHGVVAVAIAVVIRSLSTWPIGSHLVARLTDVSMGQQIAQIARPLAATLMMVAAVTLWRDTAAVDMASAWRLCSSIAVGVVAYAAVALLIAAGPLRAALTCARRIGGRTDPGTTAAADASA